MGGLFASGALRILYATFESVSAKYYLSLYKLGVSSPPKASQWVACLLCLQVVHCKDNAPQCQKERDLHSVSSLIHGILYATFESVSAKYLYKLGVSSPLKASQWVACLLCLQVVHCKENAQREISPLSLGTSVFPNVW